jgi:hypothetical protein
VKIISVKNTIAGILKTASFRNKYDLFSNTVSRKIFEMIKDKLPSKVNFKDSFYEKEEESKEEYTVDFYVKFNDAYDKKVDIKAKFYYPDQQTEPFIDIRIYLRMDFSDDDFERFHWYLYECVRHEYEHFDKYIKGFWPDKRYDEIIESLNTLNLSDIEKAKLVSELMLHYIEIDSYVKSIMYVAKKRKIPYGYVIQDILNRLFFNNDKNIEKRMLQNQEVSQIINEIKNRLIERIRNIFPATVLRDPF